MQTENYTLTQETIEQYAAYLREQERADNTIGKYRHDLNILYKWLDGETLTKAKMIEWKEYLVAVYAAASVNSMLAAVNGFLDFMDWRETGTYPTDDMRYRYTDI